MDTPLRRELEGRFDQCLAYYQAASWLKPWLAPVRFLRNQYRTRLRPPPAGSLGRIRAFHLDHFAVVHGECVSDGIAAYGIYEPDLTRAFLQLVQPGQVVVDIGMHLGYFTTLLALLVGETGEVHAFEPTPSTRELAAHNVGRFTQIRVHPFAVWSSAQELTFRDFGWRWMAFNSLSVSRLPQPEVTPVEYRVATTTLDAFRRSLGKTVALIKIDAESAELEILKGALGLLAQDHPVVTLEVGDSPERPGASGELVRWFEQQAYQPWEIHRGRFRRHQPREHYQYDNLIFAPTGRNLDLD